MEINKLFFPKARSNYNHAKLLSLVVRRIFNRTFGDFEIMLVKLFGYKLQIFGSKPKVMLLP